MKAETYGNLKGQFPVIFTAAVISLLSSTLYLNNPASLFSKEVALMVAGVFVVCGVVSAIVYGLYALLVHMYK